METKDKIAQLGHGAPGIDSLKIPGYQWWSEALHGVAGSPGVHFGGDVCIVEPPIKDPPRKGQPLNKGHSFGHLNS